LIKNLLILMSALNILLLGACGTQTNNEVNEKTEDEPKQEKRKEKSVDLSIDVNKELNFSKFDVEIKKVKVYEKDGALLADISLDWRNKANDYGSEMTFFVATQFDVKQGGTSLVEINDAWNPENKNTSDVFFPNTVGGEWTLDLTYDLIDAKTPIDIVLTPTTETEGSETITVNLTE